MSSQLKSETARINGAKSRGPITEAGREKSSQNSLKHGLTSGSAIVLACECQEDFDKILNHLMSVNQPANPAEEDLVEEMVAARWRIRRLWTIETSLIDAEFLNQQSTSTTHNPGVHIGGAFRALSDESRALSLASRYESRLHRIYDHAYATLRELQQSRKAVPAPAVPENKVPEAKVPDVVSSSSTEATDSQQPPATRQQPSNIRPFPSPKQELRNEPTTHNPQPTTHNPQPTTHNPQPTTHNPPPAYNE